MRKLAIVSQFGHMECLGFLLEILKNCEVTVIINNNTDNYKWLDYYKTLYNFSVNYDLNINTKDYDKIIKLTSHDNCLQSSENTISLVHLKDLQYVNNKSNKFISLTPYITGDDVYYMFPIYNPPIIKSNSKIVTLIGYYNDSNIDDDLILFIEKNLDYQFIFVLWGGNTYGKLTRCSNVKIIHGLATLDLIQIIYDSKYILSKKHINYDRFSGQLGLAMSFQKPMIIDYKTAISYKLPGITFHNNYCEVDKLNDISDDKYNNIIEEIKTFNNNNLSNNIKIIKSILDI
jgi:hypothetical protein